jgi:hypothetical protein
MRNRMLIGVGFRGVYGARRGRVEGQLRTVTASTRPNLS